MAKIETGHLWIGFAESSVIFHDFFKEIYSPDDEEAPLNKFIESQGGIWYDHDWAEREYRQDEASWTVLDDFLSYLKVSYISTVEAERLNVLIRNSLSTPPNATVMFFEGADVVNPQDVFSRGLWLQYVGKFSYKNRYG